MTSVQQNPLFVLFNTKRMPAFSSGMPRDPRRTGSSEAKLRFERENRVLVREVSLSAWPIVVLRAFMLEVWNTDILRIHH
jgi:hypothetical protein